MQCVVKKRNDFNSFDNQKDTQKFFSESNLTNIETSREEDFERINAFSAFHYMTYNNTP